MANSLKSRAVKGVVWSAVERFSVQGIQFVLSIILARMVAPSEYGLIAMLGIFLAVAQCFIDSGFSNALIQKKDRTETDFSTVFYFNLVISVLVYLFLYFAAPSIAVFYREPQLEIVTRWVGLNLILIGLSVVQRAKLAVALDFKTQARASLIAVALSGFISVVLAYQGLGVWALIAQSLLNNLLNTVLLWGYAKWTPALQFSWYSFKVLFVFGSKLLLSALLHTIYLNLYSLVIGRKYSAMDVGYYNRAYSLAQFPSSNIVMIINRAIYPVQCEMQNNEEYLNTSFIQYLRMSCYIIFPLMIGLAVIARPLVVVLLTDKWLPMADILSILCISYLCYPVLALNNQILNVKGRSDYFLKAEIIKKIVAILILFVTMPFGLTVLCFGVLIYNLLDCIIIIYYAKKVISSGYWLQIKSIFPLFVLASVMGIIVFLFLLIVSNEFMKLFLGVIIGIITFSVLSFCFRVKEFQLLLSMMKR